MRRLGLDTAGLLPAELRPAVHPAALRPKVVHFGLGAFHRAHQAVYTEAAGQPWGIAAVAPNSREVVTALREQDCLFSVADREPTGPRVRVVGSIVRALHGGDDAGEVTGLLVSPETAVVTLTVTEKAYRGPSTVVGALAEGLAARFRANAAPISVVSCDNLAGNGEVLRAAVLGHAEAADRPDRQRVLDWIGESVSFPDTVVDRIVPATTAMDRRVAEDALGLRDEAHVVGEPYRQWVLQDDFAAGRPPWEAGGARFVADVAPFQLTKLRLLNGCHSALAYLGAASGLSTVADVMETSWGEKLVRAYGAEVAPTLPDGGPDPLAYVDDLVVRFANPAMRHLLRQIGSDGSLKVPERWFPPLRHLGHAPVLELALAAWVASTRPGDDGPVYGTTDPRAERLALCWYDRSNPTALVGRLLRVVGAPDLAERADLTAAVAARLPALTAGHVEL